MVNTCWCQNVSERSVCATCGCCKQNVVATMKGLIFYKNAYGKFCLGSRAVNLLIVKKLWGVRHKFWRLDAIEKLQKQNLIICILFAHPLYGDPTRCKWRLAVRILIADWWPLLTLGCSETMGHKSGPWSALTRRQCQGGIFSWLPANANTLYQISCEILNYFEQFYFVQPNIYLYIDFI